MYCWESCSVEFFTGDWCYMQFSWPPAIADVGDDVSQLAAFLAHDNCNCISFLFESCAFYMFNPGNGH
jgi:hypothetical protein